MYLPPNTFTGGWNTDDDAYSIPKTDWSSNYYLKTVNPNATGGGGTMPNLVSAMGNSVYENTGLAAGTNIVIGAADWPDNESYIVAFWNSNGDHSFWQYFYSGIPPVLVYENEILNFQKEYKLFDMLVINGVLKWTDGYFATFLQTAGIWGFNPPRELDLQKAIYFSDGNPLGYTVINRQTLDVIKYPPTSGPTVTYVTDATEGSNKLYGFLYQFIYQYVYDTGAVSVWSPISECKLPTVSEFISGRNWLNTNADNTIQLALLTGPEIVTQIRVAVRVGNDAQFGVFKELDKEELGIGDNTTYVLEFKNDSAISPLPLVLENYSLVPQVAFRQALVSTRESSSVMAYANFYEGYDGLIPDVTLSYTITGLDNKKSKQNDFHLFTDATLTYTYVRLNTGFTITSVIEGDVISFTTDVGLFSYTFTSADITAIYAAPDSTEEMLTILGEYLATELGTTGVYISGAFGYRLDGDHTLSPDIENFAYTNRPTNPARSLKTGVTWNVGIQYYDRGLRDGTVIPVGSVYVKSPAEQDTSILTDPNDPYTANFRVSIDHEPPAFADTYQLVVQPAYQNFMQRSVSRIQADGINRIKMSLERFYLDAYGVVTNNGLTGGATINFTPQQGDIVRFIRQQVDTGTSDLPPYCETYIEVQVLAYSPQDGEGNSECVWINYFDAPSLLGGLQAYGGFIVEIIRPIKSSDTTPWRECSEEFSILNPYTATRAHAGNVQDQINGGIPAISDLDYGDVYLRPRNMGTKFDDAVSQYACWWIEDPYYSDYYISNFDNKGRYAIEDPNAERKLLEAEIRHSKSFLQNTNINGLNSFTFEDKASLNEMNGAISRIVMIGDTLKVLQKTQETSIYIQQAYSITPDGTGNTAFTSKVFGGIRPMGSNYGTDIAGLVCVYERSLFYFDRTNAVFIESTPSGQLDISRNQFKFKQGSLQVKQTIEAALNTPNVTSENIAVPSPINDEIQFWIGSENSGIFSSTCYTFSLSRRRWVGNMTHNVRYAFFINGYCFTQITDGNIYYDIPSSGNMTFNDIDPATLNVSIVYSVNDYMPQLKVPLNATWWSNINAYMGVEGFTPNPPAITPYAQILEGAWVVREGKLVAVVSRDATDPAYPSALRPISGRALRANAFKCTITKAGSSTPYFLYLFALNVRISPPLPQ